MLSAVQAIDSLKRKPEYLKPITFFASTDEWLYIESSHPNMCSECHSYNHDVYFGSELRGLFPFLEIVDENTIYVHVHPHCECILTRLFPVSI